MFPKAGDIPVTNQISGGDLDGDLYFICWDERLIPSKCDNSLKYHDPV